MRSHWAGMIGLTLALVLAIAEFGLPAGQAISGALEGAAFGLFPIIWIVLNAVWINKLQRSTKYFDVIARTFSAISNDVRVQAILIAFCFGAMIESVSGFGTPIAVTSVLLLTAGLTPIRAATIAVFANTAPAAFGSVGNPIQGLAKVTAYPPVELGAVVGQQSSVIAMAVPLALLIMLDGRRGVRELWPVALIAGFAFGAGQLVCSRLLTYQLADLIAAATATVAVVVLLRHWTPQHALDDAMQISRVERDSLQEILIAFSPYVLLSALFVLTKFIGPVRTLIEVTDVSFRWPDLYSVDASGRPLTVTVFDLSWLSSSGTILLVTGGLTAVALRVSLRRALWCYRDAMVQIRWAALTVTSVLALSYVMNLSGMADALGTWLAGTGAAFALLSGLLGWFGVALTGSDTASNVLFGAMQVAAAHHVGVSPLLMAATNSTGGVQGKAVSMQNLALAASAVGLHGREGEILRKVLGWSLGLLAIVCVSTWLLTLTAS